MEIQKQNMNFLDLLDDKSRQNFNNLLSIHHCKKYEPKNSKTLTKSHQNSKRNDFWGKKWGKQKVV